MADLLFRAMEPDGDRPKVGSKRNLLGARPSELKDAPERDGEPLAGPGRGGPSVSVNDWSEMNAGVRPKAFGGHNSLTVMYVMGREALGPADLMLGKIDRVTHHSTIEPTDECSLNAFQIRLASTRPSWSPAAPLPPKEAKP